MPVLKQLGNISVEQFMQNCWQKQPLLIRNAFSQLDELISAEELAGLSLEEDVNARLIIETPSETASQWQVAHGPFSERTFQQLPSSHWSLLVQHTDSLDPRINEFLQQFRFIPNWRLDDIMISYASDGGGVGPHFDYYDVLLIQAKGKRRWRLGQHCNDKSPLIDGQPMKILQQFDTTEDWILEAGDMLYVPSQLAHWGEAIGESITYSVGFRAPSYADILLDFAQEKASELSEDQRYRDSEAISHCQVNEIGPDTIAQMQTILLSLAQDQTTLTKWLGEYATRLKQDIHPMLDSLDSEELQATRVQLSPYCRTSFASLSDDEALLFVNGQSWRCKKNFADSVSRYAALDYSQLLENEQAIVLELLDNNLLSPSECEQ